MGEYILFWLGRVAAELLVMGGVVIVVLLINLPPLIKRRRCKHEDFRENMRCHGVCTNCGKDLGFIQPLRDAKNRRQE